MSDKGAIDRCFGFFARIAERLGQVRARTRYGVAFAAGAAVNLALAPVGFLPAFYLALPLLVWCLAGGVGWRSAFATGWWFGFGYFVFGLYWIGGAMLVEAGQHGWMIPFAALGLPAFLAIFFALAVLPARIGKDHFSRGLILATALGSAEWLRGHVLTGFPWNLLGQAWTAQETLLQGVALIGIYGITFVALLSGCLLAVLAQRRSKAVLSVIAVAVALPTAIAGYGAVRLSQAPAVGKDWVPNVGLRLVQAGIPQKEKWQRRYLIRNFQMHLSLSLRDRPDWISHIIWPETASPFPLDLHEGARKAATKIIPKDGLLITGMIRRQVRPERKIWNSIVALDDKGAIAAQYDKFHLVPFGEYVPLRNWLPIRKITAGRLDYSAGPGPLSWALKSLPAVSPLVCYEVIFPGAVASAGPRPSWLLVLTNDAWYGQTVGPHQHLVLAKLRAVEEGLPVVRAANTGISAIFDGYGREWNRLGLAEKGVLDTRLPSVVIGSTVKVQYSKLLLVVFLLLTLLTFIFRKGIEK